MTALKPPTAANVLAALAQSDDWESAISLSHAFGGFRTSRAFGKFTRPSNARQVPGLITAQLWRLERRGHVVFRKNEAIGLFQFKISAAGRRAHKDASQ